MICLGEVLRAQRGAEAVIGLKRSVAIAEGARRAQERAARMHCEKRWHACKVLHLKKKTR